MPKTATIADVARVAGVSRAAVSKVIRNAYGVSEEMRERVQSAISELNYRPRVSARGMRGQTFTLGFAIPTIANPFFIKVITGAVEALADSPYRLIISVMDSNAESSCDAVQSLVDRQVDGVVAISPSITAEWLETLGGQVPLVLIGRHDASTSYDTVVGDDLEGVRLAVEHLVGLGHRSITHLTIMQDATRQPGTPHDLRIEGFTACMHERGLEPSVVRIRSNEDSAHEAALRVLTSPDAPTAIIAGHDELALGVLAAVAELGTQTAVVGYDDTDIAAHPLMSLTSINQSGAHMGASAVRLLLERIQGRSAAVHEVVQPRLVVRRSTDASAAPNPERPTLLASH